MQAFIIQKILTLHTNHIFKFFNYEQKNCIIPIHIGFIHPTYLCIL